MILLTLRASQFAEHLKPDNDDMIYNQGCSINRYSLEAPGDEVDEEGVVAPQRDGEVLRARFPFAPLRVRDAAGIPPRI